MCYSFYQTPLLLIRAVLVLNGCDSGLPTPQCMFKWSVCHISVNRRMTSVPQTFPVNSLANTGLVGNMSKPHKYLQFSPISVSSPHDFSCAFSVGKLISCDLIQYLCAVVWQAPDAVCPKAGYLGVSDSLPRTVGIVSPKVACIANLKSHLPNLLFESPAEPGDVPVTQSEEILLGE